tara:strand:+ start:7891 stop:8703 length:813 start_codon:yes stop_codon:yes gene_type:complete
MVELLKFGDESIDSFLQEHINSKKVVMFDLDETLAESKQEIDEEMAKLLDDLLKKRPIVIMSGGKYKQFQKQLLRRIESSGENLSQFYLFPTCATSFYRYEKEWKNVYSQELSEEERKKIFEAFDKALAEWGFEEPEELFGELIEDRRTQVTFSAYGQEAAPDLKKTWDPDGKKRISIMGILRKYIPEFDCKAGGTTSIDVTRKGIDKGYGVRQVEKYLSFKKEDMIFVGDKMFEGGNDYPVYKEGVDCIAVKGPEDTKDVIRKMLKLLE